MKINRMRGIDKPLSRRLAKRIRFPKDEKLPPVSQDPDLRPRPLRSDLPLQQLIRGRHFARPDGITAPAADVVVELFVRKDEQQLFPNRHRLLTPRAEERGGAEFLKLPGTHSLALIVSSIS
jgi:hypothetical protein